MNRLSHKNSVLRWLKKKKEKMIWHLLVDELERCFFNVDLFAIGKHLRDLMLPNANLW